MNYYALIVAGGKGVRMGGEIPKQFLLLKGKPILMHTISKFAKHGLGFKIIVVLPPQQIDYWKQLCVDFNFDVDHQIIEGGEERFYSVKNGLMSLVDSNGIVAIHDGVRPLISDETILKAVLSAERNGSGIPCVNVVDSLRELTKEKSIVRFRNNYRLIQTPQCFQIKNIVDAYQQDYNVLFTDDATVYESKNKTVSLSEGNEENLKITTEIDLKIAEALLE